MPVPNYPGAYSEETPSGIRTIGGVPTSIALFVGCSRSGPVDSAVGVTSFNEFQGIYGDLLPSAELGFAVLAFFQNGGSTAYILRLAGAEADEAEALAANDLGSLLTSAFAEGGIFDQIDLVNLICVPGLTDPATIAVLLAAALRRRAFLILDSPSGLAEDASPETIWSRADTPVIGQENAAIYYPWVLAADSTDNGRIRPFPPSGYVAGIYARTDARRGVWKAPAGTEATISGARGLSVMLTDSQQGPLNLHGVNCLRVFPTQAATVWGGRTLAGDDKLASEWKYVPVRRLALFIEESVSRGTQWAVIEPNDERLWAALRLNVGAFMQSLFRRGAFQGAAPRDAYFVKCDSETNTQADINAGLVNLVVGFAPLKPAEFVTIRIQQVLSRD